MKPLFVRRKRPEGARVAGEETDGEGDEPCDEPAEGQLDWVDVGTAVCDKCSGVGRLKRSCPSRLAGRGKGKCRKGKDCVFKHDYNKLKQRQQQQQQQVQQG